MHFWPKFGNTDFNWWWLIARTSSKWGKFLLLSSIWPWSSRSIAPRNNRDLNQGLLHLWSKFGDSSLHSWLVIARTSWWLTDRHTHTHTQATTIPEGHNWPRVKIISSHLWWIPAVSLTWYCCRRSHMMQVSVVIPWTVWCGGASTGDSLLETWDQYWVYMPYLINIFACTV